MGVRAILYSTYIAVLLGFATAALLLLLASVHWSSRSPPQKQKDALPLNEHPLAFYGRHCVARSCAELYDVLLRQCLAQRRLKNVSASCAPTGQLKKPLMMEDDTCLSDKVTKMHCDIEQRLWKMVDGVKNNLMPDTTVSQAEGVEGAPDDEVDLQEIVGRGSERDALKRFSLVAASTHPSSLIGHIFLGALLLLSAGVALWEVFRDRLREKRTPQGVANKFAPACTSDLHRSSVADLSQSRNRRESVHGTALQKAISELGVEAEMIKKEQSSNEKSGQRRHRFTTAASFDSGMRPSGAAPPLRATYRVFGHRPPPLQRRSSFPIPLTTAMLSGGGQAGVDQYCSVTSSKLSLRSSVEQSEEESSPDLRRRVRIIRRH